MLIRARQGWEEGETAVTPRSAYVSRRALLGGAVAAGAMAGAGAARAATFDVPVTVQPDAKTDAVTPKDKSTTYNNFYELDPVVEDRPERTGR